MADPKGPERPIPLPAAKAMPAPLSSLQGRSRGMDRVRAILDQKEPVHVVRAMPITDLFYLIKEVGLVDAQELVELATVEQVQGLIDLDGWQDDQLVLGEVRNWLSTLLETGPEHFTRVWGRLDPELTALIIQKWTRIYNIAEAELPEDEEPPFYASPDRFFMVKITAEDDADVRLVGQLLDYLYRFDQEQARHTLRAAQTEPTAELEEMSLRWRRNRVAELGFPDAAEALYQVFRPLDPAEVTASEAAPSPPPVAQRLPVPIVGRALQGGFLGQVLARVTDGATADRLESAMVLLFNKTLAADHVSPGDIAAVALGTARAAATLSLGLETAARGDLDRGFSILLTTSLERLHCVGHGVGLSLGKLLGALGPRAARLDEPLASMVAPLRGQRPMLSRLCDEPIAPGTRPIGSAADILLAARAVSRVAAQAVLVHEILGVDPATIGEAVALGDCGRTACARALLGKPAEATALRLPDITDLGHALPGGAVTPEQREQVHAAFAARARDKHVASPPEADTVIDQWIADLASGSKKRGNTIVLDRGFVAGLLIE